MDKNSTTQSASVNEKQHTTGDNKQPNIINIILTKIFSSFFMCPKSTVLIQHKISQRLRIWFKNIYYKLFWFWIEQKKERKKKQKANKLKMWKMYKRERVRARANVRVVENVPLYVLQRFDDVILRKNDREIWAFFFLSLEHLYQKEGLHSRVLIIFFSPMRYDIYL